MKLTSVLAGIVALFVATTLLMYVANPSLIRFTSTRDPVVNATPQNTEPVDGKYESNPFEFGEKGPFPKAKLETAEFNFGQMPVDEIRKHTFVIQNIGDVPLKLARGNSTCKCTVGKLGSDEVPPGGSVDVEMEWHPIAQSMEFTQSATVWTNDPNLKEIRLTILGQVVPDVISYPEGSWTVTVSEHKPAQLKGMILSMLQDSFEITGIETSQPWITVTTRPFNVDEAKREMGKSGYELTCELQPVMPVGTFKETITVMTTIKDHEKFQFEISGTRSGPFNIVAPGWYSEKQLLKMGRGSSAEGKRVKMSMFASERDPPLEVVVDSVDPPVLNTSIERRVPDEAAADRLQFVITLESPQGAVPARYSDDHLIHVRLKTNHPEAPLIKFDVELQID